MNDMIATVSNILHEIYPLCSLVYSVVYYASPRLDIRRVGVMRFDGVI